MLSSVLQYRHHAHLRSAPSADAKIFVLSLKITIFACLNAPRANRRA